TSFRSLGYGNNDQFLIAGAHIGAGQQSLNFSDLWFSRQFDQDQAIVDFDADSGEGNLNNTSDVYLDFSAGILWYALMGENTNIYAGASMLHINGPNISFVDGSTESLYNRIVVHVGGELMMTRNLSFLPGVAYMKQGPSMEINAGGNFRFTNHDWREIAIRTGLWARVANRLDNSVLMDALIVNAVLELERFNLGISYDVNTSSLIGASNSRGAFEVSFIYTTQERTRSRVNCPKF
ncbi:MAG: PorP/SprF family type IX secretion system membrane protein, partial [Bacteroidota bacterium]